ncbi:MAG: sugar nucleotide-binding protein [Opitutales bacterium]|jgi:dTDP-4-dehydrorhamnose reductase|nr:sugar nucleotide-binding protein [Opitutales bacterium]MDG2166803.1 sugar nucleotide-binding protein [Opitutales bacterium]
MNLFLTGASGLLGHALASAFLDAGWTVHASSHTKQPLDPRLQLYPCDLSQTHALRPPLETVQADAIINAAAITIPAECAKAPNLSRALNINLPTTLAEFAAENKTRLIHFSTDMVFDGKAENYAENSPPNPTNLYGEHKLESENRIQELYPEACIVRLPLLMGNSPAGTRSVHEALWSQWSQGATTPLFEDEWRTPVSVCNVASLTKELFATPTIQGLFHWAGPTHLNRWEMGNLIADKLGVPKNLLQRTLARDFPQFKDRPLNLTMDSSKLKVLVQTEPAPFENQLEDLRVLRS